MEQTESELLALRREKLAALEKLGVAPFGAAFETSGDIARVREKFAEGASFRVAGRISAHRDMPKSVALIDFPEIKRPGREDISSGERREARSRKSSWGAVSTGNIVTCDNDLLRSCGLSVDGRSRFQIAKESQR